MALNIKVHEHRNEAVYDKAFIPGEEIKVYDGGKLVATGYGLGGSGEFSEDGEPGCIVFPYVTDLVLAHKDYTLVGEISKFKDTVWFYDDEVWTPGQVLDTYKDMRYRTPTGFKKEVADRGSDECDVLWFHTSDDASKQDTVTLGGNTYRTYTIDGMTWLADDFVGDDGGDGITTQDGVKYYTYDAAQRVCPDGWHVPSYDEVKDLYVALGGKDVAGKALMDADGMAVVPNGMKALYGKSRYRIINAGKYAYLWTSTTASRGKMYSWGTNVNTDSAYFNNDTDLAEGLVVRYVKD